MGGLRHFWKHKMSWWVWSLQKSSAEAKELVENNCPEERSPAQQADPATGRSVQHPRLGGLGHPEGWEKAGGMYAVNISK